MERCCYWLVVWDKSPDLVRELINELRSTRPGVEIIIFSGTAIHIENVSNYDLLPIDHGDPLYPLIYLHAGIKNLDYETSVYLGDDSDCGPGLSELNNLLKIDPIHVPLDFASSFVVDGNYLAVFQRLGLNKKWFPPQGEYFAIRRSAIQITVELASILRGLLEESVHKGSRPRLSFLVGTIAQLLSGNSARHDRRLYRRTFAAC